MTCCFTGHRNIQSDELPRIQKQLESELEKLINQGVKNFCAGGALGFDTIAALAVIKSKKEFPHVRLVLVLPCKEQTCGWPEADINISDYPVSSA